MIAYKVDKRHWWKNPIEQIDISRVTGKSYYDCRGRWALETDARRVFTDRQEAIEYALLLASKEIKRLDDAKQAVLDRVNKVLEFKDKAGAE